MYFLNNLNDLDNSSNQNQNYIRLRLSAENIQIYIVHTFQKEIIDQEKISFAAQSTLWQLNI